MSAVAISRLPSLQLSTVGCLKLRQAVGDLIVIGDLGNPHMSDGLQPRGGIKRACGDGDVGSAASGVPKQAGSALMAEPAMHVGRLVGNGAVPLQPTLHRENQVLPSDRCVSAGVAVETAALAAVAVDHVAQRPSDLITHSAAKAPAGCGDLLLFRHILLLDDARHLLEALKK